ncbi:MAG TPA: Uma2 family endonuclease [Ktedonobacterales bacterium]|jgi:Uma2 family endonuclease
MVAERHQAPMSVEDYLTLDRSSLEVRYEFVDGYAYMLAGGTANHSVIAVNITSVIHSLLLDGPCRIFNSDLRVRLAETRYVYPDATVSCDGRDRGQAETIQYPRLAIEVLSPSTEAYDRGRKFGYYRACPTMQEYVLVDAQRQAIEVYRRESDSLWTLHPFGPEDEVELASLGVRFPIAAAYRDVVFPDEDTAE